LQGTARLHTFAAFAAREADMRTLDDLEELECFRGDLQAQEVLSPRKPASGAATASSTATSS
jgi:hypothetical protein